MINPKTSLDRMKHLAGLKEEQYGQFDPLSPEMDGMVTGCKPPEMDLYLFEVKVLFEGYEESTIQGKIATNSKDADEHKKQVEQRLNEFKNLVRHEIVSIKPLDEKLSPMM